MIPTNTQSDDYRFYKTLNEDVELKPNQWNQWDITMENGDYKNITGKDSLRNAICITIMTRYQELQDNPMYSDFGCRIHELIKANKTAMTLYEMELFVVDVLENMRRVQEVNWVEIQEEEVSKYQISFSVYCLRDDIIEGEVVI